MFGIKGNLGFLERIFMKKNINAKPVENTELKRTLSAVDLVFLGVGAIIGAGIFTLSGTAAAGGAGHVGAGPGLMLSFVFAGIACALAAFCYAEFAAMLPVAGSAYAYTFASLGEISAWLIGWMLMLEYVIGSVTVACGWSGYLLQLLKGFSNWLPSYIVNPPIWLVNDYQTAIQKYKLLGYANPVEHMPQIFGIHIAANVPALVIILLVTALLYKGIQESAKAAGIMVIIKLAVILLFIGVGSFYVEPANWVPFMPNGLEGVFVGSFLVFFAYIGFDAVSTAAEETKNPQRDLPIGIITSLAICTVLYIIVAAVLTGMQPWNLIDTHAPIAAAMRYVGNPFSDKIAGLISFAAVAGLSSVLLVLMMGSSRILLSMSRDRLLPSIFSRIHSKFQTPHIVTVLVGLFVAIGTIFLDLNAAAELCNIGTLTAFAVVCLSVIILKVKHPEKHRPFEVPKLPSFVTITIVSAIISLIIGKYAIHSIKPSLIIGSSLGFLLGATFDIAKVKFMDWTNRLFIPVSGVLVCIGLIIGGVPKRTFLMFAAWIIIGLAIYFGYGLIKHINNVKLRQSLIEGESDLQADN